MDDIYRTEFGNCLVDSKSMCVQSLRDTCRGIFRPRRPDGTIDDGLIPVLQSPLPDLVHVEKVLGGGKSGAIVLLVTRKNDSSKKKFILKVYLDAYNQFDEVNNERPFREVYTQCAVNGNRGFNCAVCFGVAAWPDAWMDIPTTVGKINQGASWGYGMFTEIQTNVIIDQRFVFNSHPPRILYLMMNKSKGESLMTTNLVKHRERLPGLVMEIWAVWTTARRKMGENFTHWDFHPDNLFVDWETPRRTAIQIGDVEINYPTVTVIDFDLVMSDLFDNELPEHAAKRASAIGLTERALQWLMKWLPPSLVSQWLAFLILMRKTTNWNQDYAHLWTYTAVCLVYYFRGGPPKLSSSVEAVGKKVIGILTTLKGINVTASVIMDVIRMMQESQSRGPTTPTRASKFQPKLGMLLFTTVDYVINSSVYLLNGLHLIPTSIIGPVKDYTSDLMTTLMDKVQLDAKTRHLAVQIPVVLKDWSTIRTAMELRANEVAEKYLKLTGRYASPDDVIMRWCTRTASGQQSGTMGLALEELNMRSIIGKDINVGNFSVFLGMEDTCVSLKSKALQFSLDIETELSIHLANWTDVVSENFSSWSFWKSLVGYSESKTEQSDPLDGAFKLRDRNLNNWKVLNHNNTFMLLTLKRIIVKLDNPISIRIHLKPGKTDRYLLSWIMNWIFWMITRTLGIVVNGQNSFNQVVYDWQDKEEVVAEMILPPGDPHPCVAALGMLTGSNMNLSEALDCASFLQPIIKAALPNKAPSPTPQYQVEARDAVMKVLMNNYASIDMKSVLLNDNEKPALDITYVSYVPHSEGFHLVAYEE